jgi:hypothetical protein
VPRRRNRPHALLLGALLAALAAPSELVGQTLPSILRPVFDGDPHNPQRFRKLPSTPRSQVQKFGNRPASGAGKSGFDSTNGKQRKAKAAKQRSARTGETCLGAEHASIAAAGAGAGRARCCAERTAEAAAAARS